MELGKDGKPIKQYAPSRASPQVIDLDESDEVQMIDVGQEESDQDTLFVSDRPRFPNERGDRPKGKGRAVEDRNARVESVTDEE